MDYYKILEVDKNCSDIELKKLYKKLTLKWHPDKNIKNKKKSEERFKNISEAYQILSNPYHRQLYDNGLKTDIKFSSPSEIFREFFTNNSTIQQYIDDIKKSPEIKLTFKTIMDIDIDNMNSELITNAVINEFESGSNLNFSEKLYKFIDTIKNCKKNYKNSEKKERGEKREKKAGSNSTSSVRNMEDIVSSLNNGSSLKTQSEMCFNPNQFNTNKIKKKQNSLENINFGTDSKAKPIVKSPLLLQKEAQLRAYKEAQLRAHKEAQLRAQKEAQLRAHKEAQLRAQAEAQLRAQQETRINTNQGIDAKYNKISNKASMINGKTNHGNRPEKRKISKPTYLNINISLKDIYMMEQKKLKLDIIKYIPEKIIEKKEFNLDSSLKKIVLKDQGSEDSPFHYPGDIIIRIYAKPHPDLKIIHSYDIFTKKEISIYEAYHGFQGYIDYLDNEKILINYNESIINKDLKIIKGKGLFIPKYNKRGDLFIKFVIRLQPLNPEEIKKIYKIFPPLNNIVEEDNEKESQELLCIYESNYSINKEEYYNPNSDNDSDTESELFC